MATYDSLLQLSSYLSYEDTLSLSLACKDFRALKHIVAEKKQHLQMQKFECFNRMCLLAQFSKGRWTTFLHGDQLQMSSWNIIRCLFFPHYPSTESLSNNPEFVISEIAKWSTCVTQTNLAKLDLYIKSPSLASLAAKRFISFT